MNEEEAQQLAFDVARGMVSRRGSITKNPWCGEQIDKYMIFHDISEE